MTDSDFKIPESVHRTFKAYYSKEAVLYEIVKYSKNREVAFIGEGRVRGIMAHAVRYLVSNFKAFRVGDKYYNMYHSVALLDGLTAMSYVPKLRKVQLDEYSNNFDSMAIGYDFVLDFDGKLADSEKITVTELAKKDCEKVKSVLDELNIEYSLKFSGSGFHIVVKNKTLGFENSKFNVQIAAESCRLIAESMIKTLRLKTLDTSIYDKRRIWKLPYSMDIKTGRIALPLTDNEFRGFETDMADPESERFIDSIRPPEYFVRNMNKEEAGKLFRVFVQNE